MEPPTKWSPELSVSATWKISFESQSNAQIETVAFFFSLFSERIWRRSLLLLLFPSPDVV
jgi:hypothetical protein